MNFIERKRYRRRWDLTINPCFSLSKVLFDSGKWVGKKFSPTSIGVELEDRIPLSRTSLLFVESTSRRIYSEMRGLKTLGETKIVDYVTE